MIASLFLFLAVHILVVVVLHSDLIKLTTYIYGSNNVSPLLQLGPLFSTLSVKNFLLKP